MTIHGDDLAVATHGRSFWILDDITPLRQTQEAGEAGGAWLYRPETAVRVDNDGFLGTPLPPEEPTAENPPNGAVIDYYLKSAATQIKVEILDGKRNLVRSFMSDEGKERKHPPLPIAERWLPQPAALGKTPGMHRFVWNLAWGGGADGDASVDDYGAPRPPRATPGNYEVRLTVDGKAWTQPLKISMDPRSPATAQELEQQLKLGQQIFAEALQSRRTLLGIHSVLKQLSDLQSKLTELADLKARAAEAAIETQKILGGNEGASGAMGLEKASSGLASALRVVESGDRAVPAQAIELYQESSEAMKRQIGEWSEFRTTRLSQLNRQLQQANVTPIAIPAIGKEVE
jgi:hypothetical protein